jgi:hypothetical protein
MDAGLSPQEATTQVVEQIGDDFVEDADDGPVFWLVLASLQLEADALDADVAERAKAAIPANLERWREEATDDDFESRRQVLGALQQRLPT